MLKRAFEEVSKSNKIGNRLSVIILFRFAMFIKYYIAKQAATKACERNQNIIFDLLGHEGHHYNLELSNNWHPKGGYRLLKNDEYVQFTSEKPIMMG